MQTFPQHRPVTLARRGIVAAPHYLAAEAGLELLKAGGNAVDAAIAASAMLQVVYPFVCGLGGDVFMLIYDSASGQLYGLNGSGRSPGMATIERYHELGYTSMPGSGIHTITVPGCASGWEMAMKRFGASGLSPALAPAISYAEEGFAVGPDLVNALHAMTRRTDVHPSWHRHFLPDGTVPEVGSIVRYPTLARSLRAIATQGADVFYHGELAEQIAGFFAREGGLITSGDLAAHKSEWMTPLSVPFGDLTVFELPPNTQGITALQMLGLFNRLPAGATPLSPETVHLAVEAKKVAFADRAAYLTDPAWMSVAPETLIESGYLDQRSTLIDPEHAHYPIEAGNFRGDTVYMCAADRAGNVVSLIQSNYQGFGSGVVVDHTGIVLQNRGSYFSLDPSASNALAPSKRTLHTLIPSMALRNGRPAIVFGAMGGDGQAQTHLQVYSALAHYGLNIQQAIEMPRWLHESSVQREQLLLESRFPPATVERLRQLGHTIVEGDPWITAMGYAQGIVFDQKTGVMYGGSDPRAEGIAAGW